MADPCFPGSVAPIQLSYFTSGFSALLSITITVGNVLIILAVIKDPLKKLRTPFAFFLVNAAVSDFAVGAIAMPVSTIFHYKEAKREINIVFIYILHLTYFISATASLASIAAMAIDRHQTLISLRATRRKLSPRTCILISTFIWIAAFGFSGFYFLLGFVSLALIYVNIALVSSFGITLLTYLKVMRRMRRTTKTLRETGETTPNQAKANRATMRENRVTKVFMSMLFAYLCIYLPTVICSFFLQFCLSCSCSIRHVFRDMVFVLVSAGSATNPIVCFLKMKVIRQSLYVIVTKRRPPNMEASSSVDLPDKRSVQKPFVIEIPTGKEVNGVSNDIEESVL